MCVKLCVTVCLQQILPINKKRMKNELIKLVDIEVRGDVRNPWVELTLENRLVKGGYQRAYRHMVKLTLNQCETLGS